MSNFQERYAMGTASERLVLDDLKARGWTVEPGPRAHFSDGLNKLLMDWRDSHSAPCFLRWSPDWLVWRSEPRHPSNLFAVDVKTGNGFHVERRALETYVAFAERFNIPTVIVFHVADELFAISAGKLELNTLPRFGAGDERTPYYEIDMRKMSPMERFFGAKLNGK